MIPITAVTSDALNRDRQTAPAAGCDDYVPKPFSPRQLLAKIRKYLQQRLARLLKRDRPDILVANSTPSLVAARQATQTIPIVFVAIADPVAQGFIQSLAHPGGNVTGFGTEEPSMGAKWVQLLSEIVPRLESITVMFNPDSAPFARMFLPAMEAVRVTLHSS